jgi:hypothetical protein
VVGVAGTVPPVELGAVDLVVEDLLVVVVSVFVDAPFLAVLLDFLTLLDEFVVLSVEVLWPLLAKWAYTPTLATSSNNVLAITTSKIGLWLLRMAKINLFI